MKAALRRPQTIEEVATGVAAGAREFDPAVREFIDSWQAMDTAERSRALSGEPPRLTPLRDAYLAALAEHLAQSAGMPVPELSEAPDRFLSAPFFAGGLESLKATLLVESPLAFRRRLIFISADGLSRPLRTPSAAARRAE